VARISLIIEEGMQLVGQITFTPVVLGGHEGLALMGLAPMAVLPARQRCGFGTALVEEGLLRCQANGCGAVVVLGHPAFYRRFGFDSAANHQITCQYDVPDDVFMALEFLPGYLEGNSGCISYHPVFAEL
jgi:putative acetyltransferase